jgi:spermidine synthase
MSIEVLMLKDDPISTVAVTKTIGTDNSFSIIVNGKSDSNIVSDGGTIGLFSILPYLSTPTPKDINVAMIGMGTGVSAGLMGTLPGVSRVDLVEISDAVIEAQEILENENFAVMKNPKVIVHKTDAFRFFSHPKGQYDLILSEPSNPWVVGVENLFTGYFYDLVDKSLSENGIFAQWFHLYSISRSEIAAVLANLLAYFPNTEGYTTQTGDLVFLSRKGTGSSPYWNERANHPEIAEYLKRLKIRNAEELKLLKVFGAEELRVATISTSFTPHNLFQPTLSNNAHKSLFLDNSVALQLLLDPFLARVADLPDNREKFDALKTMGTEWFKEYRSYCDDHSGFDPKTSYPVPLCLAIANEMIAIRWFDSNDLELKIKGYSILRKSRLIDKDLALLETAAKAARTVFEKKLEAKGGELLLASIGELIKEGRYERALEIAKENEDILGKQRLSDLSRKALTSKELADKVKGAL